jgi:hypothetical protein
MPYEGTRGAFWALLGPDVRLMRTEYDVDAAVRTMAASGFPQLDEMLEESLLEPAHRDELAQFFERQATSQDKP